MPQWPRRPAVRPMLSKAEMLRKIYLPFLTTTTVDLATSVCWYLLNFATSTKRNMYESDRNRFAGKYQQTTHQQTTHKLHELIFWNQQVRKCKNQFNLKTENGMLPL
jgi:hypothetical protein